MEHLTISIPEELKRKMDLLKVINWSEVAREAFVKRVELSEGYERFEKIVSKSRLTEKDVEQLSKDIAQHFKEKQINEEDVKEAVKWGRQKSH